MTKFNRVLSDDDLLDVYRSLDNPKRDRDGVIEAMGAAVDAAMRKLAEQEPVAWRVWLEDLQCWSYSCDCHGCGEPLYAHPCVSPTRDKTACVSEIAESEMQVAYSPTKGMNLGERIAHVGGRENKDGYIEFGSVMAVHALISHVIRDLGGNSQGFLDNSNQEGSSWLPPLPEADVYGYRDSYSEELLIEYAKSAIDHYRTTKSRTPASGENVNLLISVDTDGAQALLRSYLDSLEGWQLVPSEPTMDMIKALLETIVTTSKGGVVNPKTTLTYALAAAPKYTGESK